MEHFGKLLKTMREAAGLGIGELGVRADISDTQLRRTEAAAPCSLRRSTALAIFNAINDKRPVARHLSDQYFRLAKLTDVAEAVTSAIPKQTLASTAALRTLLAASTRDEARAFRLVADLLDAAGAVATCQVLEGAIGIAEAAQETSTPTEPRTISVRHPPVQRDGYVEERIVDYEHRDEQQTPAEIIKRKRGTA